jgi:hypothetical protein|tara:strand:- start:3904 stop:4281 length:378 start_codon:yes stop_codon:yes gene_type:complete
MGQLKNWLKQDWVRIGADGSIKGPCGTSKDKSNPDRCLPRAKANSLSKAERAKTARKKKRAGSKGKTTVANTKAAKVTGLENGGAVTKPKRPFRGKKVSGTVVARGCGAVMANRRKRTSGSVSQA